MSFGHYFEKKKKRLTEERNDRNNVRYVNLFLPSLVLPRIELLSIILANGNLEAFRRKSVFHAVIYARKLRRTGSEEKEHVPWITAIFHTGVFTISRSLLHRTIIGVGDGRVSIESPSAGGLSFPVFVQASAKPPRCRCRTLRRQDDGLTESWPDTGQTISANLRNRATRRESGHVAFRCSGSEYKHAQALVTEVCRLEIWRYG